MKPLRNYLMEAYEKTTIDQIAEEYRSKGYEVKKDVRVGDYRIDLSAEKDGQTIYVEVKTHTETPDARHRIRKITEYFKNIPNAKFILAIARYQEPIKIEFVGIDEALFQYFILELPSDLDGLSTHTRPQDVTGVSISELTITDGKLNVTCKGSIGVNLQYGSDSETEIDDTMYMSFPFKFKGTIEYDGKDYGVSKCDEIEVDTDAFYG